MNALSQTSEIRTTRACHFIELHCMRLPLINSSLAIDFHSEPIVKLQYKHSSFCVHNDDSLEMRKSPHFSGTTHFLTLPRAHTCSVNLPNVEFLELVYRRHHLHLVLFLLMSQ